MRVLSDSGPNGCCNYARVKVADDNGGNPRVVTFTFQTFAAVVNSTYFHNPDPIADYERCHANAIVNGQFFSPNCGKTWLQVFYIKTPYQSECTSVCTRVDEYVLKWISTYYN